MIEVTKIIMNNLRITWINPIHILQMVRDVHEYSQRVSTRIDFITEDSYHVIETPEEILKLIKENNK